MTSYTKALYRRDPAAAEAFYRQQKHEQIAAFGRNSTGSIPAFGRDSAPQRAFGKRIPSGLEACAASCGHPACKHGCTLLGQQG